MDTTNEPVAWMSPEGWVYGLHETRPLKCNIPLYTHPVKELTDEEIVSLYKETEADNGGIREFAKAILRKAQEK